MLPAIILSGGLAERLKPLTDKIPKALLPICGQPFIFHQLKLLKEKGFSDIVVSIGFLGDMIETAVGDGSSFALNVRYCRDGKKPLGTGGALKKAVSTIAEDDFFVLYGDAYLDINYKEIERTYFASERKTIMTVYKNGGMFDKSNVIFRDGLLKKYSKKNIVPDMDYIDYGLGIMRKSILFDFDADIFDLAQLYEKLSDENSLLGYEVFNRFYEIGSLSGIKELEVFLNGKNKK